MADIVNVVRYEQIELMLQVWRVEPILGSGVGSPIAGYSRTAEEEGLTFEAQYPMVLYRTGIVGFIIILTPFLVVILRTIKYVKRTTNLADNPAGIINLAMCCSLISLLAASVFNPYLASSMGVVFICLSFASDSAIGFLPRKEPRLSPNYETS